MKFLNFAWVLFVSAARSSYDVHATANDGAPDKNGGEIWSKKVDWSKKVHQFNLKSHLTTPLPSEIEAGVHNSRRLARNHIRLGIDEEHHRKLVPVNPPKGIVKTFPVEQIEVNPSTDFPIDVNNFIKPLPFGDGPGVKPGLPEGTFDFWRKGGNPRQMWEVVACPVADVSRFLSDPLSCIFGGGNGTLMDFFSDIPSEEIKTVLTDAIVPIAVEVVWSLSPLRLLEEALGFLCDALGFIDEIIKLVEDVEDVVGGIGKVPEKIFNWFGSFLSDGDSSFEKCEGAHLSNCKTDSDSGNPYCDSCFKPGTSVADCEGCVTCWKPLEKAVSNMDGICLDTPSVISLFNETSSAVTTQALFTILLSNYIEKLSDSETNAIEKSVDKIDHTCKSTTRMRELFDVEADQEYSDETMSQSDPGQTDSQKDDEKFEKFLNSDDFKNIKERVAQQSGLRDQNMDEVMKTFKGVFGPNAAVKGNIKEQIMGNPNLVAGFEKIIDKEMEINSDKYQKEFNGRLLQQAINSDTGALEVERLKDIRNSLADIQDQRSGSGRNLLSETPEEKCNKILQDFKKDVQEQMSQSLESIINNIVGAKGDKGTFGKNHLNTDYDLGFAKDLLLMPVGFVKMFDPFQAHSVFRSTLTLVIEGLQRIAGLLIFGVLTAHDKDGYLVAVSDGSVRQIHQMSFCWVLATADGKHLARSCGECHERGSSLLAEAVKMLSISLFMALMAKHRKQTDIKMVYVSDNLHLINTSKEHKNYNKPYPNNTLPSEFDTTEQSF